MLPDKNNFGSALKKSVIRKCCNDTYALMRNKCVKNLSEKVFNKSAYDHDWIIGHECQGNKEKVAPYPLGSYNITDSGDANIFHGKIIVKKYFDYCIDYIDNYSNVSLIMCIGTNDNQNTKEYVMGKDHIFIACLVRVKWC